MNQKTIARIMLLSLLSFPLAAADSPSFVIAGLKLLPVLWDKEANFRKLEQYTRKAAAAGADLIVTPEGYLDGYSANAKIVKDRSGKDLTREKYFEGGETLDGPFMQRVAGLARDVHKYLLVGFAERRGDKMYNTIAMYSPEGKVIAKYSKSHVAGEPFNELGSEFPVFETPLARFGLLVCFDRQMPEPSRILAIKGAQVILVPAFGLGTTEINEDIMMRTRAYENSVYVAHVHPVNTFIVDPKGKIIAQAKGDDETMVLARIVLDQRIGSNDAIRFRRPEIYGEILGKATSKSAGNATK